MSHKAHSMSTQGETSTSTLDKVWFVNSEASNHITSHEDWFLELRKPDRLSYVKIGEDTTRPIRHVGNVPFENNGKQNLPQKRLACPNNHEKSSIDRPYCRTRNASVI